MQAIITKYLPATNTRASRIKATCDRGSITVEYPHDLSGDDVHCYAANRLCEKFVAEDVGKYGSDPMGNPWALPRVCGGLPGNAGCAHVFTPRKVTA